MKKINDDSMGCNSCYGYQKGCCDWVRVCTGIKNGIDCHNVREYCVGKYYANNQQCEHLLNLWDDANGSIKRYMSHNKTERIWIDGGKCPSCSGLGKCADWCEEIGLGEDWFHQCKGHKCFCQKPQTESLLKWHDDRYGKIGERLMDVDEKLDSLKVYGEKEKAVDEESLTDKEHLKWIHARLVDVHGENELFDYMHKLRAIISITPDDQRSPLIVSACPECVEVGKTKENHGRKNRAKPQRSGETQDPG